MLKYCTARTRIKATRIVYWLVLMGACGLMGRSLMMDGDQIIVLASSAEMDADLQNGILRSARMVLSQKLQLAAAEIHRVDGRYTQLYKTVASSCQVCAVKTLCHCGKSGRAGSSMTNRNASFISMTLCCV